MARKTATEFNRSLIVALAAAFVVIAVVAIIVYTPAARTGQFHGAEAVETVTWQADDFYDFETKTLNPQSGADIKSLIDEFSTAIFAFSPTTFASVGGNTDCSSTTGYGADQIEYPGSETYFCVRTGADANNYRYYNLHYKSPSSFDWVQQGICGDGFTQADLNEQCDDGNAASGDGCSSTCQTEAAQCSGTPSLTLEPASGQAGTSITATVSGLSDCDGKTAKRATEVGCSDGVDLCTISGDGCQETFTAPDTTTTYYACVDGRPSTGVPFIVQTIGECVGDPKPLMTIDPKFGSSGQITPTINSDSLTGDCIGKTIGIYTSSACSGTPVSSCTIQSGRACNPAAFTVPEVTTTYYMCLNIAGVVSDGSTFTAPPTVTATHIIQGTVATITANANNQQATNTESKIKEITILVDNTLVKTCLVDPEAPAATCEYSGTYSASSTHTYYGKAKNNANLEGQSSPQGSFTIPADANLPSITNIQATQPLNPGVATTVSWQAANVNHFEVSYTTDTTRECKEQDVDADGSVCGGGASGWNCIRQHTDASGTPNAAATAGWTIPAGMVPTGADYKDVQIRIEGHGTPDLHKVAVNACQTLRVTRPGTVAEVQTGQVCTQSGQQMACYSGTRGTKDIGLCKGGVRSCYQNKTWSACVGEVIPTTYELCDGLDDNCNFISDDALIGGQPVASGACNTPDKCGTNRVDCTKTIDVQFGEPACLSNQNNVFSCGFACLNGFTECGGSCFRDNGNGGCANDVWVCSGGSELDPVASECMLKEPCTGLPAGTGQQCYTGPTGTENIGECNAGFRTCGAGGFWTICSGQAWPDADVCDGKDNNCNGLIDDFSGRGEGSACPGAANCGPQKIDCNIVVAGKNVDAATCISNQCKVFSCTLGWQDKDGKAENGCETRLTGCIDPDKDGYGALNTDLSKCAKSKTVMDCDSKNSAINPGMNETCNGKDDDCDGLADEDILETRTCGFGVCAGGEQTRTCEESAYTEWSECSTDYLKGTESATVCNALDDDCNGILDDTFDVDKDGFPANVTACVASYAAAGKSLDCNDKDKLTFPGANETCNGIDNDCNGVIDDFMGSEDPEETLCACSGMSASEVKLQKKEVEEINGIDDNCDGKLALEEQDFDGDGFTPDQGDCDDKKEDVNPDADELCSTNYDDNCDGKANEGCAAAVTRPAARNISILDLAFGTTPRPAPAAPTPLAPPEMGDELPLAPEAPTEEAPFEEVQAGGEEFIPEAKKPNYTLLASIISLVAAALGGALWFVRTKMKANVSAEAEAFGIGGPEETGMEDVKGFVSSSMAQGHPASAVKGVLSEKGWQGGDIDQALEETAGDIEKLGGMAEEHGLAPDQEAGLKKYISNARASGFSDAQIKAALINGGWDAKAVGKYL